jgi:hypothetical protein
MQGCTNYDSCLSLELYLATKFFNNLPNWITDIGKNNKMFIGKLKMYYCNIYFIRYVGTDDFFVVNHQQKAGKIEKEGIIKDSSQVRGNISQKNFHQNIRGLGNKTNELYCNLQHDLPHILCLSEHYLSESELQLIHLADYSFGARYSRKTFLKGGVTIFVYRNLKYNTTKIDEYNIDKDFEACTIYLDSTLNKLCILAGYRSPNGDFTIFLKLDLILQKVYNNKYSILTCGDVNANYLIDNNLRSQLDAVLHL